MRARQKQKERKLTVVTPHLSENCLSDKVSLKQANIDVLSFS